MPLLLPPDFGLVIAIAVFLGAAAALLAEFESSR